ncbi:MAG: class I SAM-dependent methyltransferase [Faecalibacterium sp.]|jgi:SAM-dependent methyltransferase|nr:class I SAM-dependent methyltransferase [Faecalibacterium sp.]
MKKGKANWYKTSWSLDIKQQSWTENTEKEVSFLIRELGLCGNEKILDLACGYGRHALEFARRGYHVVGVDITKAFIDDAEAAARRENLPAQFILSDIRDVSFTAEFDVVINMADGAIGYLESESENLKIFDIVSRALKPGGQHFMDIMSADYADTHYPCKLWDSGKNGLTLSAFEWDKSTNILLYGQNDFCFGDVLKAPDFAYGNPTRLYHSAEIDRIMKARGMATMKKFCDYDGTAASENGLQLMVMSKKI